ncbi:MAG: acetyltransferase [Pirellulales bacterium]
MTRPDGVVLVGAGGHAKVVQAAIEATGRQVNAVFDDDPRRWGQTQFGVRIEGPVARLANGHRRPAVIAIGANEVRRAIAERLPMRWVTVVHPHALVHPSVRLGPGTLVCAGAIIQPDCQIGRHCIVSTAVSVDHDCRVDDFAHLAPGVRLAGNVHVGAGALLGVGAVVVPGIAIGESTTVGAGGVVIRDLPPRVVAVGSPATVGRAGQRRKVA